MLLIQYYQRITSFCPQHMCVENFSPELSGLFLDLWFLLPVPGTTCILFAILLAQRRNCRVLLWRAISIIRINEGVSTRGSYRATRFRRRSCVCSRTDERARIELLSLLSSHLPHPCAFPLRTSSDPAFALLPPSTGYRTWRPMPRREAHVVVSTGHTCIASTGSLLSVSGSLACNIGTSKSERVGTSRCERAKKPQPFPHDTCRILCGMTTTRQIAPSRAKLSLSRALSCVTVECLRSVDPLADWPMEIQVLETGWKREREH